MTIPESSDRNRRALFLSFVGGLLIVAALAVVALVAHPTTPASPADTVTSSS